MTQHAINEINSQKRRHSQGQNLRTGPAPKGRSLMLFWTRYIKVIRMHNWSVITPSCAETFLSSHIGIHEETDNYLSEFLPDMVHNFLESHAVPILRQLNTESQVRLTYRLQSSQGIHSSHGGGGGVKLCEKGPKREEVAGGWRRLQNEELHNL
jgi:hypothetical protein